MSIFINIDLGLPRFSSEMSEDYVIKDIDIDYARYEKQAEKISIELSNIINKEKLSNLVLTYKVWNEKSLKNLNSIKKAFIANMIPDWQTLNATYVGNKSRFDAEFKGWNRTVRTGEIQNIIINLPRLALKSNSQKEFFSNLKKIISCCCDFISSMAELTMGEFFRGYELRFPSIHSSKKKWNYLHIEDCMYCISIIGLNETIKILISQEMGDDPKLAVEILSLCNNYINASKKEPFRVLLKEEVREHLVRRFYLRDSALHKSRLSNYSAGVSCANSKVSVSMHKYLLGGHCLNISENEFNKLIDSDFGLVYLS